MGLENISTDYLRRLIAESGVKLGSAKASAMAAIIELIDENSLGGLLKSIRDDYDVALNLAKQAADMREECYALCSEKRRTQSEIETLQHQRDNLAQEVEALRNEKKKLDYECLIGKCGYGQAGMLRAYQIAIDVALEKAPRPLTDRCYAAIVRSACAFSCQSPLSGDFNLAEVEE